MDADRDLAEAPTVTQPASVRGVIFDLWDTLVDWPHEAMHDLNTQIAAHIGIALPELHVRLRSTYRISQTGPYERALRALGVPEAHVTKHVEARFAFTRTVLNPRPGVLETLAALRARGIRTGLISMCSEDVVVAWPGTAMAELLDTATFSATTGLVKPEPEIYLATAAALGLTPHECLFVGDGANNELAGAEATGMTAVLIAPADTDPQWLEVRDWQGQRVTTIPEVLELC